MGLFILFLRNGVNKMTFGKWPEKTHEDPDQQKRIQSAKSAKLTPMSVDAETQTGFFGGSAKEPYRVTLDECTCVDYIRRKLPCKHIYRLAMELGLFSGNYEISSNPGLNMGLPEAVGIIENYSDELQQFLILLFSESTPKSRDFLHWVEIDSTHEHIVGSSVYIKNFQPMDADCIFSAPFFDITRVEPSDIVPNLRKKDVEAVLDKVNIHPEQKMLKAELAKWCLENVPNLIEYLPERYYIACSPRFQTVIHKIIKYLRRKYEWDSFYNENMEKVRFPYGAKFVDLEIHFEYDNGIPGYYSTGNAGICYFPNDEITELLTLYGHNRCLNGYMATAE